MPSLDDSVQVIGESNAASSVFQATRSAQSTSTLAELIQPPPLASMSNEIPRIHRSRILNFSIIRNDTRTAISVHFKIYLVNN